MAENAINKNHVISELTKSPHGNYKEYVPVARATVKHDPEFIARLIAWNRDNGQIRDSKVALPVITTGEFNDAELTENSLAHLGALDPRNLLKAMRFALELRPPNSSGKFRRLVEQYLRYREADFQGRWVRNALQFRVAMKELYSLFHVMPCQPADNILFKGVYPRGSVFYDISMLSKMSPTEAAAVVINRKIPFLTARRALGKTISDPDVLMSLIERMSPTELVTNTKQLEKLGMRNMPAVRGAFEKAVTKLETSTKNALKTTKAVESVVDEGLRERLKAVQEKQMTKLATIEGDWLVLGDKSPSMAKAIDIAKEVAALLAKSVKGKVYLVFFDSVPLFYDVTGKTYDEIISLTRRVTVSGGTSIGCGLQMLMDRKLTVNGIAVISDAQENTSPGFAYVYTRYVQVNNDEPTVYLYRCPPSTRGYADRDLATTMSAARKDMQEFIVPNSTDYYSVVEFAKTMNVKRYTLIDNIMSTPLLTLKDVFDETSNIKGKEGKKKTHA